MKHIKCKFIALCDHMGDTTIDWRKVRIGVRACVERLEDHPMLGAPDTTDRTVTSKIRSIDFEAKVMITQNNVYFWEN